MLRSSFFFCACALAASIALCESAAPIAFLSKPHVPKDAVVEEKKSGGAERAEPLASLEQVNVVGIAPHPGSGGKILYADETAVYELDGATRRGRRLAGVATAGLLSHRQPLDGRGLLARFVYITKLLVRGNRVFIFDNDRLRELNARTLVVRTIATLSTEPRNPVSGTVSWDASSVYWYGTAGVGHSVMRTSLARPRASEADLVTGGGSIIAGLDVSADGKYLYLSDVETNTLQRVSAADGSATVVVRSPAAADEFSPGALAARRNGDLWVVNTEQKTIELISCGSEDLGDDSCEPSSVVQLSNPQDVAASDESALALDATFNGQLPTYNYFIKRVTV